MKNFSLIFNIKKEIFMIQFNSAKDVPSFFIHDTNVDTDSIKDRMKNIKRVGVKDTFYISKEYKLEQVINNVPSQETHQRTYVFTGRASMAPALLIGAIPAVSALGIGFLLAKASVSLFNVSLEDLIVSFLENKQ